MPLPQSNKTRAQLDALCQNYVSADGSRVAINMRADRGRDLFFEWLGMLAEPWAAPERCELPPVLQYDTRVQGLARIPIRQALD